MKEILLYAVEFMIGICAVITILALIDDFQESRRKRRMKRIKKELERRASQWE